MGSEFEALDPADFLGMDNGSKGRRAGNRPRRRYFLIVSEGTKTEPNYLNALRDALPKEMVKRITVVGGQAETLKLIERAEQEIAERRKTVNPPFYHVWIVFDRDSFKANRFDTAVSEIARRSSTRTGEHWHAAWSNEAFELWYLYHFRDECGGGIKRNRFKKMLSDHLRGDLHTLHGYHKNATDMFELLDPLVPQAVRRARRVHMAWLKKTRKALIPFHKWNPCTTVYELVAELLRYRE